MKTLFLHLKYVGKDILLIILSVFLGVSLMAFSYSFSTDLIEKNVSESADVFLDEARYPSLSTYHQGKLDNYTDALMLLEASNKNEIGALRGSLANKYGVVVEDAPDNSLIEHFINGEEFNDNISYSRYWHGYLVFLKPFLVAMDYTNIRVLNMILQFVLVFVVIYLLIRRGMGLYSIPFIISVLLLSPLTTSMSIQYSTCYYVLLISFILLLSIKRLSFKNASLLFCLFGILTSFFDLLTYPLVTLGMPLALYYCLDRKEQVKYSFKNIVSIIGSWGIGYVGMWFGKWVVSTVILRQNVISDSINQFFYRSSGESFSRIGVIEDNYVEFFGNPLIVLFVIFMIVTAILIIRKRKLLNKTFLLKHTLVYLAIALLPALWYFVATNHSGVHYFFTNRAVVISVFSLMCLNLKLLTDLAPFKQLKKQKVSKHKKTK